MNDYVPAGYLTHIEAFHQFVRTYRDTNFLNGVNPFDHTKKEEVGDAIKWQGDWNGQWETYVHEFIGHIRAGEIEFLVVHPATGSLSRILPDDWNGDWWPSRPFLSETIQSTSDSRLMKFTGRTPFVDKNLFITWLNKKVSERNGMDAKPVGGSAPQKKMTRIETKEWIKQKMQGQPFLAVTRDKLLDIAQTELGLRCNTTHIRDLYADFAPMGGQPRGRKRPTNASQN